MVFLCVWMPIKSLGEDQLNDYKEAFALFDASGKGYIEASNLGDCLRACGQNPTNAQVKDLAGSTAKLDWNQFVSILKRDGGFDAPGSHEEFVHAFQVFDKEGNGFISSGELRYVLTSLGEKLSNSEVDGLLKSVEVTKDGFVNYQGTYLSP